MAIDFKGDKTMPMQPPTKPERLLEGTMLSTQVEQALTAYFQQLGETPPHGLYQLVIAEIEIPLIKAVLQHTSFNRLQAAKKMGISRTTFHKKLNDYGLEEWIKDVKHRNVAAMEKGLTKTLKKTVDQLSTPAEIEETA